MSLSVTASFDAMQASAGRNPSLTPATPYATFTSVGRENLQLAIQVDEPFTEAIAEEWIRRVVEETLSREGRLQQPMEVGVVVGDDALLQELNQRYRGIDEPTDVLSFALTEPASPSLEESVTFVTPPDGMLHLGEVIISYPRALEQARESRWPVQDELGFLLIHGVLHLLGYDHEEEAEAARMRSRESEIWASLSDLTP